MLFDLLWCFLLIGDDGCVGGCLKCVGWLVVVNSVVVFYSFYLWLMFLDAI